MTRLDEVLDVVASDAEESERERRITARTLTAMRQAGLLRLCVPKALGGGELEPLQVLNVIERLARVDGAAGWCAMIAATSGCVAGHLDPGAAATVYGNPDGLVVGPFAPLGTLVEDASGMRVTGRWPYASLCQDASWLMLGTSGPSRERRLVFVPAAEVTVHDTWSVMGLCATGSHDVEVVDVAVPPERSVPLTFDAPVHQGPLYQFPVLGLLSAGIASVTLGLARGAIDDLVELAGVKTPTYSLRRLAERPATQVAVASAEARLDAARSLLVDRVAAGWERAVHDGTVEVEARIGVRVAAAYATTESAAIVTAMYGQGGGTAAYLASAAQRRLRDVHTATQHAMVSTNLFEVAGRHRLGLRIDPTQM